MYDLFTNDYDDSIQYLQYRCSYQLDSQMAFPFSSLSDFWVRPVEAKSRAQP
jgi:hypothetical protein